MTIYSLDVLFFLILNQAASFEHFPNLGCYSPCSFPHLSHVAHLGTLNGAIRRWNSLAESWTGGESSHSFTHAYFPHGRNFRPRWWGIMVELNYSSSPFNMSNHGLLCSVCWTFSAGLLFFHRVIPVKISVLWEKDVKKEKKTKHLFLSSCLVISCLFSKCTKRQ